MRRLISMAFMVLSSCITYGCSSGGDALSTVSPPDGNRGTDPTVKDSTTAIYRQFFFQGTHNSYSGNLDGMKREGIATQLERGLRFFEFDLYSYHTPKYLETNWLEEGKIASVFDYQGNTHLLSYSASRGAMNIYKVLDGKTVQSYSNDAEPLDAGEREFSLLTLGTELYILSYESTTGDLIIYAFDGEGMDIIFSDKLGAEKGSLSTFVYKGTAYVSVITNDGSVLEIRKLTFGEDSASVGSVIYEDGSVDIGELVSPFEQDNALYIFKYNAHSAKQFSVDAVDTHADTWSKANSVLGMSEKLMGEVQAAYTDGKLYVNSYGTNGDVIGFRLIIDKGMPNLVYEYNNEGNMLTEADASTYPAENGYYLFLQKGQEVQLSHIDMGKLTLGHDAPGDEVDFSVDNPSSIFLEDWISYIVDWSNAHPYHEPLFIMTELKDYEQWMVDAKWQNIIRLMQNSFGDRLRYHSSDGFSNETIVDNNKIVDGKTRYFMDDSGSKEGGLLGKVVLYIQPNIKITRSADTNNFEPFMTKDGKLQENFLQLKRYRENNKLVSPDWRHAENYGNDIGAHIDGKDDSYISRIFHMQSPDGDGQYDNIRCTDVMFAVSDRPYQGLYVEYAEEQKVKNQLATVSGCDE